MYTLTNRRDITSRSTDSSRISYFHFRDSWLKLCVFSFLWNQRSVLREKGYSCRMLAARRTQEGTNIFRQFDLNTGVAVLLKINCPTWELVCGLVKVQCDHVTQRTEECSWRPAAWFVQLCSTINKDKVNSIHFLSILNIPFGHNKQTQSSAFGASFPTHLSHSLQTTPCYIIFLVAVRLLSLPPPESSNNTEHTTHSMLPSGKWHIYTFT